MSTSEGITDASADRCFGAAASRAKPDDVWVETAWTVLEAASDLGDDVTIEAYQRVIDDRSGGDLTAQSDLNIIFGFLDAHAN
jgi:hypothetical protein